MDIIDAAGSRPLRDADLQVLYPWPAGAVEGTRTWVRCNMVMTLDGAIAGQDGRSGSIASPVDKHVFLGLRRDCDVILVGAGTARAEGYRPATVPIALVSRSLHLAEDLPLFAQATTSSPRTLVITTEAAAEHAPSWLRAAADLVPCGATEVDLASGLAELRARGLSRVHCEGGPALMGSLIAAGSLDELLLTITPMLLGGGPRLIDDILAATEARITQVLAEDGTLLLRVAIAPAAAR